jgi:type 1 glutamine amidotransferase
MATHIYVVGAAVLCAALAGSAMAAEICRGTDPRCYHDWAKDKRDGNRVLIYTRTAGPRHGNLGPPLAAGLNPTLGPGNIVQSSLRAWLAREGIEADWTEDVTSLTNLNRYKAVIFASTSRDALFAHSRAIDPSLALNTSTGANLDAARTALRQYMRAGGGFVGIHNAFGTEYNWPWYEGLLGGANYYDHGPNQPATVQTVDRRDVSTAGLPERWNFTDEWYNLVPYPSNVRVLLTVDERTMAQGVEGSMGHPGHGSVHPLAWCQYYDGGRAFLTTLGHDAKDFATDGSFAGAAEFQKLIVGGIQSAAGMKPFCR